MPFSPIPEILADLRAGKMIVLTDDEDRENEGDLVLPARFVTPGAITFMLSVARGYMCLSLTEADCDRLDLHPQSAVNTSARGTPFTVSIDGHPRHGFTTGVSARERARTILMAIDPASSPDDFVRPGHINPLRSREGGVLVRTGQTEGSLDLCRLAGLGNGSGGGDAGGGGEGGEPSAIIIEIMRDDGEMARVPDLERLCAAHGLRMCSVAQVIEWRLARESLVRRLPPLAGSPLRTAQGPFTLIAFESLVDPLPHVALTLGGVGELDPHGAAKESPEPTLVRMHRRHLLGDVFGDLDSSSEGATGETLRAAMAAVQRAGRGAIIYLRPDGRAGGGGAGGGVGAGGQGGTGADAMEARLHAARRAGRDAGEAPDLAAHHVRALAPSGVPRHMREFGIGGQVLRALGLSKLRLLTNHQTDMPGIEAFGLEIVERVPLR